MLNVSKMIVVDLIPKGRDNRPGGKMTPTSITVHNTGNSNEGADAKMHSRYIKNPSTRASWHYTVDDKSIYQHLPLDEHGWHAGDGRYGEGNRTSIGIEICMNKGIDQAKAERLATQLIGYLMVQHGIPLNKVVQHNHWSGKNCPSVIRARANGWQEFMKLIPSTSQNLTTIIGKGEVTVNQMVSFALKGNPFPALPYCTVRELAEIFIQEAVIEGVRPDVAWAQSLKETGYFKYGGIVVKEQNNYAGIGALNGNNKGQAATFDSPRLGVRAQIQHLKAYGSEKALEQTCVDPRFHLVTRGSSKYVQWLGYKDNPNGAGWAYPGEGYGNSIVKIMEGMKAEVVEEVHWGVPHIQRMREVGLITGDHDPEAKLTWAEFGSVMTKLLDMLPL